MAFSSFESHPPFSGLGGVALALLKGVAGETPLAPSGPVPGSYTFYEKQGFVATMETEGAENMEREPDVL